MRDKVGSEEINRGNGARARLRGQCWSQEPEIAGDRDSWRQRWRQCYQAEENQAKSKVRSKYRARTRAKGKARQAETSWSYTEPSHYGKSSEAVLDWACLAKGRLVTRTKEK